MITTASELVDWFIEAGLAEDRNGGVKLGQVHCDGILDQVMSCDSLQILVDTDYIHHVVDEHAFEDGYLFFRFRKDGMACTCMCVCGRGDMCTYVHVCLHMSTHICICVHVQVCMSCVFVKSVSVWHD